MIPGPTCDPAPPCARLPRYVYSRRIRGVAAALLLGLLATRSAAGQAKLTHLYPAAGGRGQTLEVTAYGDFPTWPPPAVWIDRSGLSITPLKDKGRFEFKLDAQAKPGTYWWRVVDAQGASDLRPFVVDQHAHSQESEPNNDLTQWNDASLPAIYNGRLEKRGDIDTYRFVLQAGESLVARLQANQRFGSPMDAVLQLVDADGFILDQNDDEQGLDPTLTYRAAKTGLYYARVFAFPETPNSTIDFAGGSDFVYRLTLSQRPVVDFALPFADHGTPRLIFGWNFSSGPRPLSPSGPATVGQVACLEDALDYFEPHPIRPELRHAPVSVASDDTTVHPLPSILYHRLSEPGESHRYRFQVKSGMNLQFSIESRQFGFPLDAVLALYDSKQSQLASIDDTNKQRDCTLSYRVKQDDVLTLEVRDLHDRGGPRFPYRLVADNSTPAYRATVERGTFQIDVAQELSVPIKIEREHGMNRPITFSLQFDDETAAKHIQFTPATSKPDGETAKAVALTLQADQPIQAAFSIIAQVEGEPPRLVEHAIAGRKAFHVSYWLTSKPPQK